MDRAATRDEFEYVYSPECKLSDLLSVVRCLPQENRTKFIETLSNIIENSAGPREQFLALNGTNVSDAVFGVQRHTAKETRKNPASKSEEFN
jgi:hypothetical protein